jgi:MFS transporter, ACS family, hexuronate transporter
MIRWRIAILVSAAIALSYLDRQTLPVAVQAISRDIPLTNSQFSILQSAFLFAYAFMYIGGGKLVDALNTRLSFTLIMVFWSLACASHGLAVTFSMLVVSRFLLGMGEGGGFPAATRVVAEWFPTNERATAMGIINGGTAIGAIAAPPLIALILIYTNWRLIFFVSGALGLIWTVWWRRAYFPFGEHPKLTGAERAKIQSEVAWPGAAKDRLVRWQELLRVRETWALVAAKTLSDGAGYFYLFWLPKYLFDARGFDIKAVGATAGIPQIAAGIGCLLGGWFSSYLLGRRFSLDVARKVALGLSAAVMPLIMLVPHVAVFWAIVIFSLALFGQQSWSTLVMVLPTDLFPTNVVGTVAGLVGFGGAMGGVAFGELAGYLLDHGFGYRAVFNIAGTFHMIALLVIVLAVPRVQRLDIDSRLGYQGAR